MTIRYWRYELVPRRRLSAIAVDAPRQGALISVDGGVADVHPWPELGDLPIDEQLARLLRGETTPLTRRSLQFAATDAEGRRRGRSVFEGLTIPPSHWPAGAGDVPDGFDTVKVKMAPGTSIDPAFLKYKLRLDFNCTLDRDAFLAFIDGLDDAVKARIDFVEDPVPYDPATWRELRERTGVRLALDRGDGDEGVDVLVVKPAVQDLTASKKPLVITSYMDHPLGQLGAAYVAAAAGVTSTCGLATHVLYEADPFLERMKLDGNRLVPPGGSGFGFDDLLDKLPWKKLE